MPASDTIVAAATPAGRSALAIVRVDGPLAATFAHEALRRRTPLAEKTSTLGIWRDRAGAPIDLHGEPDGQAEGVGERQHGVGLGLEGGLIVDIAGGAMVGGDPARGFGKEEAVVIHGEGLGGTVAGPPFPSSLFGQDDTACLPSPRPLG